MALGIPAAFLWLGLAAMFSWPRFWGTSPRLTCPRCGARSQTTARFCHACAQTLVVRAPEATKRSSLGKALGGVGRLLAAFSGAALAFVLVVTAVYYLRLDTRFGAVLLLLPLLLASVACVVLVARPKTYADVELTDITEIEPSGRYVPPHRYSYSDNRVSLRPPDWPLY